MTSTIHSKKLNKEEEELKIKQMLNLVPPKSGKLRPIQMKKNIKASSSKIAIDCESMKYKTEYPGVYEFLQKLDLEKYLDCFIQNGIDNDEKLNYLNDEHLKLIKLPYVHRVKILKQVNGMTGQLSKCKTNIRPVTHGDYEEIIAEPDNDYIDDKQEQMRTFSEAILAFKQENMTLADINYENFKIINNNTKEEKPKEKPLTRYGNEEDVQVNIDKEEKEESIVIEKGEYTEEIDKNNPQKTIMPLNQKKTYCYHCLRMILKEKCIVKFRKTFCSIHCLDKFEEKNITKCSQCLKKAQILTCVKVEDKQYCSLECFNKANPCVNNSTTIDIIHKNSISSEDDEPIIDILGI